MTEGAGLETVSLMIHRRAEETKQAVDRQLVQVRKVERVVAKHSARIDAVESGVLRVAIVSATERSLNNLRGGLTYLRENVRTVSERLTYGLGKLKRVTYLAHSTRYLRDTGMQEARFSSAKLTNQQGDAWSEIDQIVHEQAAARERLDAVEKCDFSR